MATLQTHDTNDGTAATRLRRASRTLAPGYFAMVMATGMASLDIWVNVSRPLSVVMYVIAGVLYVALVVVNIARAAWHRHRLLGDLRSPSSAFAFLTFVAATSVLAAHPMLAPEHTVTAALFVVAVVAWLALLPNALRVANRVGRADRHLSARGNWLLAVVSTQSLAIVSALLADDWHSAALVHLGAALWLLGMGLYVALIVPVARSMVRLLGRDTRAITGDYWITMGALAITMLSTGRLLEAITTTGALASWATEVRVTGHVVWALCTTWVPVMVYSEARKFVRDGMPTYDPSRWSTVFPLVMYAAGSDALATTLRSDMMRHASHIMLVAAIPAWVCAAFGFGRAVVRASR